MPASAPANGDRDGIAGPSSLLLPGQPLPPSFTKPPQPACGSGCYEHEGRILSSVVGRPRRDGAVVSVVGREEAGLMPEIDAVVIGTVSPAKLFQ
ncbi:exosome 3'-_5 exonuclease subunit ski4 (Csl4) [Saitozyma podzolica]|uniref:Exosome 3'->5 exonuclease subunit ski4 (Csl4) n=1 Tax=Saitozyma podzolica TaxID=1890683 RepID=A0A427YDE5_9TREE|nr:exosome 3'->5 exonuclease subunit ski4 (Csl4) [Saitozyma podzolica]